MVGVKQDENGAYYMCHLIVVHGKDVEKRVYINPPKDVQWHNPNGTFIMEGAGWLTSNGVRI